MTDPFLDPPEKPRITERVVWRIAVAVLLIGGLVFAAVMKERSTRRRQEQERAAAAPLSAASATPPPATSAAGTPAPKDTAPDRKVLQLLPITTQETPDAAAVAHLVLHIPIKAQPGVHVEVNRVTIDVLFYDLIDNVTVDPTSAYVQYKWVSPPPNWTHADTEELDVEYNLPKPKADGATPQQDRKFFGYLARVYYDGKLQDAVAQPERLAHQYPAPTTLPEHPKSTILPSGAPFDLKLLPKPDAASPPTVGSSAEATLDIFPIKAEDEADENATKRFRLRIPIKARAGAQIDVKDVVVDVLFYDVVNGTKVVATSAKSSFQWAHPPPTWKRSDIEELDVEYLLPKPDPDATIKRPDRKYYGYIARLYYQGRLQASKAEPDQLARQYPPPSNYSEKSTP